MIVKFRIQVYAWIFFQFIPETAMEVIDKGCSNGELGSALRSSVPGRKVIGIEGDTNFCEQTKARLDAVIQADLDQFDWKKFFPKESVDCLIFSDVLEHLVDPWKCLKSACFCLRPGGTVIVSVPNIRHITAFFCIFLCGRFPRISRGLFDRTHLRWFTISDATNPLITSNLDVEKYDYSLRIRDRGDGLLNKATRKLLTPVQSFYPIKEFLSYGVCIQAKKPLPPIP